MQKQNFIFFLTICKLPNALCKYTVCLLDGLEQDCGNPIANVLEFPHSCAKSHWVYINTQLS